MKYILLNFFFLFSALPLFSQISNSGFETWTNSGVYEEPASYTTSNSMYFLMDMFANAFGADMNHPATVVKEGTSYQGSFAIRLQNVEGTDAGVVVDTLPGFALLGHELTSRPVALTGYYKFNQGAPGASLVKDTATIMVGVTKWNSVNNETDIIGMGMLSIVDPQSTYSTFTIDLSYLNGSTPDSLIITLFSGATEKMFPGTSLTVDVLALTGITGINIPLSSIHPVHVYPNPTTTEINLEDLPKGTAKVEVKDLHGRSIKTMEVNSNFVNFSTAELPSGLYYYSLTNEEGSILYTGKFDVRN